MDLSALIFVALAAAWAAYLIPKALLHHEDSERSRTIERFSDSLRVLARREPVSGKQARLVVSADAETSEIAAVKHVEDGAGSDRIVETARPAGTRSPAAIAARRRLIVVCVILGLNAVVAGLAAFSVIGWLWQLVPAGLLVAWLVACRLMVKQERAARPAARRPGTPVRVTHTSVTVEEDVVEVDGAAAETPEVRSDVEVAPANTDSGADDEQAPAQPAAPRDPSAWDPIPVTLPTYVSKPTAQRTVRTIDLDSTGVWTSGNTEKDSKLAREADEVQKADRAAKAESADEAERRASGS